MHDPQISAGMLLVPIHGPPPPNLPISWKGKIGSPIMDIGPLSLLARPTEIWSAICRSGIFPIPFLIRSESPFGLLTCYM
jgi:hypothetical protein